MIPSDFPESNKVYDKPIDMSVDECEPLNVWEGHDKSGQAVIISCWKLTTDEVQTLLAGGRLWVFHYGSFLQPHALTTKTPFNG